MQLAGGREMWRACGLGQHGWCAKKCLLWSGGHREHVVAAAWDLACLSFV